ncbi:hypothetical protein C942_01521 [Photobacterium marinum]|uniref:Uncharacterized protein n=1 Tax=Photobacterium marinum TaxID=1056511 RepID=L8JFF2_9GAMM|nr:hypothetical protein C942_01521 [Photobacterium marinum]
MRGSFFVTSYPSINLAEEVRKSREREKASDNDEINGVRNKPNGGDK